MTTIQQFARRERVMALYRSALKLSLNWAVDRQLWYDEAAKIRSVFEKSKNVSDPATINRLITNGEDWVAQHTHCDPYIVPYCPGGSLYARNSPVPGKVKIIMDYGREDSH